MRNFFTFLKWVKVLLCIVWCQYACAQYGPGGIGNADGSNGQPQLLLWLDGAYVNVNVSNQVISWPDRSGNAQDFTPATGANITYLPNAINNRPALVFDGGINSYLKRDNFQSPTTEFSVYIVYQTQDSRFGLFSYKNGANPDELTFSRNGTQNFTRIGAGERTSSIKPPTSPDSYWSYGAVLWDGSGANKIWEYDKTAAYESANDANFGTGVIIPSGGTAILGQMQLSGGAFSADSAFDGQIAEVIVYGEYVNKAETRILRSYLKQKYNIGPGGGWDKFLAPNTFETPAAIGRDGGSNTEHLEGASDGMILASTVGGLQGSYSYLLCNNDNASNSIVATDLPAGVQARWNRTWFVRQDGMGNGSTFSIAFDFSDGIAGLNPTNAENYVLLRRNGTGGNFVEVALSDDNSTKYIIDDRIYFSMDKSLLYSSEDYYTLGSRNTQLSSLNGVPARSWYAYNSGAWSNPFTWTLDGSAAPSYVNPNNEVPAAGDIVTIGSGRTVTASANGYTLQSMALYGTLDLGTTTGHDFSTIKGNGRLKVAAAIPAGDMTAFADATTGGTLELYGAGMAVNAAIVVNELEMNMASAASTVEVKGDITINGDFKANTGNFQIYNNALLITSYGNVLVDTTAKLSVRSATVKSDWYFYGDLINLGGEVRFTNRTSANYTADDNQRVTAYFMHNTKNQVLQADGVTFLSRLVVDKGADMTYKLTVSAENPGDFEIFGRCNYGFGGDPYMTATQNLNSVVVVNGTLEAKENVFLPLGIVASNNYSINETAAIWINGGSAARNSGEAVVPYGQIKVSAGTFDAPIKSGITTRGNGVLIVEGGTASMNQFRTSVYGSENVGGLIITGGTVNIGGSTNTSATYYTLSLTYSSNIFKMSGGVLNVSSPASNKGLVFINSSEANISVTGGEVMLTSDLGGSSRKPRISSRAPFWNLTLKKTISNGYNFTVESGSISTDGETMTVPDLPLVVKGKLHLESETYAPVLDMTNGADLYVEGNMLIDTNAQYLHGTNTTYFNGNSDSRLFLPPTTQTFHNVVVDKEGDNRIVEIVSGNATAMEIQNDLELLRGNFINHDKDVVLKGDMINYTAFGNNSSSGFLKISGNAVQTITSNGASIQKLKLENNASGNNKVILSGGDLVIKQKLDFVQFASNQLLFDIGAHKLTLDTNFSTVGFPTANQAIITNGFASAGGIELFFGPDDVNQNRQFPLAVLSASNTIKSVPAQVRLKSPIPINKGGYIAISPAQGELPLADVTAGNLLQFHWKMKVRGFETIPYGGMYFDFLAADVEGSASTYVPGKVLDGFPFTRSSEPASQVQTGSNNRIWFTNSTGVDYTSANLNFVDAYYTAGEAPCFIGGPQVFFSRKFSYIAAWNDNASWNEGSQFGTTDGPYEWHGTAATQASDYPKAGDVAIIGFSYDGSSNLIPHQYEIPSSGLQAAEIRFTPYQDEAGNALPRFSHTSSINIFRLLPGIRVTGSTSLANVRTVSGEGQIHIQAAGDVDFNNWFGSTDIGGVLNQDSSIVLINASLANITVSNMPAVVPNLYITSGNNGAYTNTVTLNSATSVTHYLDIVGSAKLLLAGTISGEMSVGGDLRLLNRFGSSLFNPELRFPGSGSSRQLKVYGNVTLNGTGAKITVQSPDATQQQHVLEAWGNIYQTTVNGGLDFFSADDQDFISLQLRGEGQHTFNYVSGPTPDLWNLVINKGTDTTSTFTFNTDININGPSNLAVKSVDLRNGLLKLNHPNIDITLSSGATSYSIPASAGLELNAGSLLIEGPNNALYLSGLLRITGGTFTLGTSAQNNFIEYSTGGSASINIQGGTFLVGGQIRRNISNDQGVLKYRQTGGLAKIGIYDAVEANRGVLEITNPGSEFTLTGNAQLIIARGLNNAVTPSLYLNPATYSIGPNAQLILGDNATPAGAVKNIGVNSAIPLPTLTIAGLNEPVVHLISHNLVIQSQLNIVANGTLLCNAFDLELMGNLQNDGFISATEGAVIFNHSSSGSPYATGGSGSMDIYDFIRTGDGTTNVNMDIVVNNNFTMNNDNAVMNFGTHKIEVLKDILVDGTLHFTGGQGLVAAGTVEQFFRWTGANDNNALIDIFTSDNSAGVRFQSASGFILNIGDRLRLRRGVFNLNGNLLYLSSAALVEPVSAFGTGNFISTNGAYTDYGVKKQVPANNTNDVTIPMGLGQYYLPIRLVFSDIGYNSGNTISEYTFQISSPQHTIIVEDTEDAPGPQINDLNNVLNMYFSLKAEDVGPGLKMDAEFFYHDDYVLVTAPYTEADYIGARVFDDNVTKFPGAVDPALNLISMSFDGASSDGISGDYFAGIDKAIPDIIPIYHTTSTGDVNTAIYDNPVPGGGAPNGSIVYIESGHNLHFNINNITFYKTIIKPGAVLTVDATTAHRLGQVSGTGLLKIDNTGVLPSGNYTEFFSCTGGSLEFSGNQPADIMGNLPIVRNLYLTGSGNRMLANNDIEVCELLQINGPHFINANNTSVTVSGNLNILSGSMNNQDGSLLVEGDFIQDAGSFTAGNTGERTVIGNLNINGGTFNPGSGGKFNLKSNLIKTGGTFSSGNVLFAFNNNDILPVNQMITGAVSFTNLEIDNPAGVTLQDDITATKQVKLTNGHINTTADNLFKGNTNTSFDPPLGRETSFINGPMELSLTNNDDTYFPVGKVGDVNLHRPVRIFAQNASRTWTVEYMDTIATVEADVDTMAVEDALVRTISQLEYWVINSNTTGGTMAKVGLSWGDSSTVSALLGDYQNLEVMGYNTTTDEWKSYGGTQHNYANDLGTFVSESAALFSKRYFTLGSGTFANPLPVTFLNFSGEATEEGHLLHWATATETNNDRFVLERSSDGVHFQTVGTVAGSGTSNQTQTYTYLDATAPAGYSYYRLRQVDFDGKFEFAPNLVALFYAEVGEAVLDMAIYPNPSYNTEIGIYLLSSIAGPAELQISDMSGRVAYNRPLMLQKGANEVKLNTSLPAGVYVVAVFGADQRITGKLIIAD